MYPTEHYETHPHCRVLAEARGASTVLACLEGAGGRGQAEAAERAIQALRQQRLSPELAADPDFWEQQLASIDQLLFASDDCGECSLAVVSVSGGRIAGASAGDCGAWMLAGERCFELTANQARKPRLGSAEARATGFGPFPAGSALLLATHGIARRCALHEIGPWMKAGDIARSREGLAGLAEGRRDRDILELGLLVVGLEPA